MSEDFVRITGEDVVIWNGCSEEWTKMILAGYQDMEDDDEIIQVDVYVDEEDYGHVTKLRDNLEAQLDGADPEQIVTWENIEYRLGLSTDHAEELIEKLETSIEVEAHAHEMEFRLHRETFEDLVLVLAKQWRDRERLMTDGGSAHSTSGTDPFTPDGQSIAKGFCETTRPPQARRKQGRRTHCLYFRFRTVCPSIHRLDTVLDRIETQDTGVIHRRAKKRSVWIEHLLILDEFCSLRAGTDRNGGDNS